MWLGGAVLFSPEPGSDLIRADVYFWGSLMAAGILGSVPVAVAYSFFVDNYISGLTAGATKG
jgi:multiple sugar transport system permease protein